jgi:hypothetical protein
MFLWIEGVFWNSFTKFSDSYLHLIWIFTFQISFRKYSSLQFWLPKNFYVPEKIYRVKSNNKKVMNFKKKNVCRIEGINIRVGGKMFSNSWPQCSVFISMMDFLVLLIDHLVLVLWDVLMVCRRYNILNLVPRTIWLETVVIVCCFSYNELLVDGWVYRSLFKFRFDTFQFTHHIFCNLVLCMYTDSLDCAHDAWMSTLNSD